ARSPARHQVQRETLIQDGSTYAPYLTYRHHLSNIIQLLAGPHPRSMMPYPQRSNCALRAGIAAGAPDWSTNLTHLTYLTHLTQVNVLRRMRGISPLRA